jgi:hypothetical protein
MKTQIIYIAKANLVSVPQGTECVSIRIASRLMLFNDIKTVRRKIAALLNVTANGTYGYHWALQFKYEGRSKMIWTGAAVSANNNL